MKCDATYPKFVVLAGSGIRLVVRAGRNYPKILKSVVGFISVFVIEFLMRHKQKLIVISLQILLLLALFRPSIND